MPVRSTVGQRRYPELRSVRVLRRELFRHDTHAKIKELSRMATRLWPLIAATQNDQQLPARLILSDLTQLILFKLSHPEWDDDAVTREIARFNAGISASKAERASRTARAQQQADALSVYTGASSAPPAGARSFEQDLIDLNRHQEDGGRFEIWQKFLSRNPAGDPLASDLALRHRNYGLSKIAQLLEAMERLRITIRTEMSTEDRAALMRIYRGDVLRRHFNWKVRSIDICLMCAVASARLFNGNTLEFETDRWLADRLYSLYSSYHSQKCYFPKPRKPFDSSGLANRIHMRLIV